MAGSSVPTATLRALSVDERRRKIVALYRRTRSLEGTARALDIPYTTLWRIMADEPEIRSAIDDIRERGQREAP